MRSAFPVNNMVNATIALLLAAGLLFGPSQCIASAKVTAPQDLLLWKTDLRKIESIDLVFKAKGCTPVPHLTVGNAYRIKLDNQTGNSLADPLPRNFLASVSALSISLPGMRMEVSTFHGIEINNGSSMTLELIPLNEGRWDLSCNKQPIIATAATSPFPPVQPEHTLSVDFLKVPKPVTEFNLKSQSEHSFDLSSIKNRWTLLFFGYTFCPDVCPTSLFTLASAYKRLPQEIRDELNIVFVSVDPERDTPKTLEQYTKHFHNDFFGVTGSDEQIANLADQLAAGYRLPRDRSNAHYTVSHTADYFLLSPDARLVARMNHKRQPAELTAGIREAWHYFKTVTH